MIRTEMGAADLTSSAMAAPAEGEAFFELGMKYASGRSGSSATLPHSCNARCWPPPCAVGRKAAPWRGDGRPRPRAPPPPIARPSTPPYPRPPPLGHRWRQCSDANRTWKAPGQVAGPSSTKGYSASGPKPRAQTDPDCRRAPSVRQGETQLAELRFVSVRHECEEGEHAAGWERDCKRSLGGSGVAD